MKRLLLCFALLAAWVANAQPLGPQLKFGVHGNVANLNVAEPLNEVYGLGYGGGAHLDVKFVLLSVRVSGDYITFSPDNDKFRSAVSRYVGNLASGVTYEGGKVNIFSTNVNAKFVLLPLPIVNPYLTGGVGLASLSVGEGKVLLNGAPVAGSTIPAVPGETKPSINIGAGVDLDLPGLSLFLEAKYFWVFTEGDKVKFLPISLGITF
jgi:hypothetical protein